MINECYYDDFDRKEGLAFDTKVVHGALGADPITGAVSFPIFQTATFRHRAFGISTGYDYSRVQNPTRQELERTMAILENGLEGFAFTSGQAANMALFTWLPCGSHVLLSDDIYGGTFRICDEIFSKFGCTFDYIDMSDLEAVKGLCADYFGDRVPVAIGESEGVRKKPAPDTVFRALEELGVPADRAVYVGDSDVDIETARNGGMSCISVSWGFRDTAFLLANGARTITANPEALARVLA